MTIWFWLTTRNVKHPRKPKKLKELLEEKATEQNKEYERDRWRRTASLPDIETPDPEGYIPRHWNDGEKHIVFVEKVPGSHTTESRPHYE